jgi:hypothetical protein
MHRAAQLAFWQTIACGKLSPPLAALTAASIQRGHFKVDGHAALLPMPATAGWVGAADATHGVSVHWDQQQQQQQQQQQRVGRQSN